MVSIVVCWVRSRLLSSDLWLLVGDILFLFISSTVSSSVHCVSAHTWVTSAREQRTAPFGCAALLCMFVVFLFVSFPHFRLYTSSSIRFPFLFPAGREVSKPPRLAEHPIGDTIKSSQHYNITSQEYCCAPSACSSIRRRLESHRIVVVEISVDIFLSTTASWE